MKLLLDTNIYIPLEPTGFADVHVNMPRATELAGLCNKLGFQLFVHPAQRLDIGHDSDEQRRSLRLALLGKYAPLPSSPPMPEHLSAILTEPDKSSNDWVDYQLLAALSCGAVDYLVSNDDGVHRWARRLGIPGRVLSLDDAVLYLSSLADRGTVPPPAVVEMRAYELREDPIFDSFREDYGNFDAWLEKCKLEHRQTWVIDSGSGYAGVAIVKTESKDVFAPDKTLKLCSFKVSEGHGGRKYGELLLKAVFGYARENGHADVYVTVFPKYAKLIHLLEDFGFEEAGHEPSGEIRLSKPLAPTSEDRLARDPLAFHVRFGPYVLDMERPDLFIVPILPTYHRMLFPEWEKQRSLFPGEQAFGNTLKKAYLCHSNNRHVGPGSVLLFYRSDDTRAITNIGVAEQAIRSQSASEIQELVMPRTVYSAGEIGRMCRRETLAILFRHCPVPVQPVSLHTMLESGVLAGPPQTITRVRGEAKAWIVRRLER